MPTTATPAPTAIFAGAGSNAVANVRRSSRTGVGVGTTPTGIAATTVSPSNGPRPSWVNRAVLPSTFDEEHGNDEPWGPEKHVTCVMPAGAVTIVSPCSMGTSHSVPIPFQKSSSWSWKWFSAPSTE